VSACLKREKTMLGALAEPDRGNATKLRNPTTGCGAAASPPSAPLLGAAFAACLTLRD
jgi:hypothetical protein